MANRSKVTTTPDQGGGNGRQVELPDLKCHFSCYAPPIRLKQIPKYSPTGGLYFDNNINIIAAPPDSGNPLQAQGMSKSVVLIIKTVDAPHSTKTIPLPHSKT